MSETADQELSDIDAALATLNTSVALATAKFSDLANKLQAALDAAKQQGFTPDQLSGFASVKSELASEAANLAAAANAADPTVAVTVSAAPEPTPEPTPVPEPTPAPEPAPEPTPVAASSAPEALL